MLTQEKKKKAFPHGIFTAGGTLAPTQEKKSIFAAEWAFMPTQEEKKRPKT